MHDATVVKILKQRSSCFDLNYLAFRCIPNIHCMGIFNMRESFKCEHSFTHYQTEQ